MALIPSIHEITIILERQFGDGQQCANNHKVVGATSWQTARTEMRGAERLNLSYEALEQRPCPCERRLRTVHGEYGGEEISGAEFREIMQLVLD